MKTARVTPKRIASSCLLLLGGVAVHASLALAQTPPLRSDLPPETRSRVARAAQDPTLEPWQRDFMLGVTRGNSPGGAAGPASAIPSPSRTPEGITSFDGDWTPFLPPPGRAYEQTAVFDPVREQMLVFGGQPQAANSDVWALPLAGNPAWSTLAPIGTRPPARSYHTVIYDTVRDRMVVFGGEGGSGLLNDVWVLSLGVSPVWSQLSPSGTPPAERRLHTAVYDPVRDRMLIFGGLGTGGNLNDVWELSLTSSPAWSELSPAGTPPTARYLHSTVYDAVRDRMLIFGGFDGGSLRNDVWDLSLSSSPAWNELSPAGTPPSGRYEHSAIYDPMRDRMVVFGGYDSGERNDLWVLALAGSPGWSELSASGTLPSARRLHAAIFDPLHDRMLVFGGVDLNGYGYRDDVHALSLDPSPTWSALVPGGPPPTARYGHSAILDPARHRMVVFGGFIDQLGLQNDAWALSLEGSLTWTPIDPSGDRPSTRYDHSAIYDPVRNRMIVFGGWSGGTGYSNDLWSLSLGGSPGWTELTPTGSRPSPRHSHTACYDPVRDRMVVFGGTALGTGLSNEVWALWLAGGADWSQLVPTGTPPSARGAHTAVYDPVRDRMVVFGGGDGTGRRNDVWALSLAGPPAWSALAPAGTLPSPRSSHTSIYDPVRDRMVAYAGYDGSDGRDDAWALSLSGSPIWSPLSPTGSVPVGRFEHTAIYDPAQDRMVVFGGGGSAGSSWRNDVAVLAWSPQLTVPGDAITRRFELALPRPNPTRGAITMDFELASAARVTLDVFDTQGRRVKRVADEMFTAGRHMRTWRGDDEQGRTIGSGLYFVRIQSDGSQTTRRMVRIR